VSGILVCAPYQKMFNFYLKWWFLGH